MGRDTGIQWCDHTFNPWWGCVRVSPGCEHCYAETWAKRTGQNVWGPAKTTPRRFMGDAYWRLPLVWAARAKELGIRPRVFCGSMCDVLEDHREVEGERERLLDLIDNTPDLDWLLLTKRAGRIAEYGDRLLRDNIWLGVSVESQEWVSRLVLLNRAMAHVRFVSIEPLLGPIDFSDGPMDREHSTMGDWSLLDYVDWVIVGGESGPKARACDVAWIRDIVRQAREADCAVFVKQLGARPVSSGPSCAIDCSCGLHHGFKDRKGGDPAEWPADLCAREFPRTERRSG